MTHLQGVTSGNCRRHNTGAPRGSLDRVDHDLPNSNAEGWGNIMQCGQAGQGSRKRYACVYASTKIISRAGLSLHTLTVGLSVCCSATPHQRNLQAADAQGSWPVATLCNRWVFWVVGAVHTASKLQAHIGSSQQECSTCASHVPGLCMWGMSASFPPPAKTAAVRHHCMFVHPSVPASIQKCWGVFCGAARLSVVPAAAAVPEVYKEGTDPEIQAYQAHQKTAARPTSAEDARTLMKLAK